MDNCTMNHFTLMSHSQASTVANVHRDDDNNSTIDAISSHEQPSLLNCWKRKSCDDFTTDSTGTYFQLASVFNSSFFSASSSTTSESEDLVDSLNQLSSVNFAFTSTRPFESTLWPCQESYMSKQISSSTIQSENYQPDSSSNSPSLCADFSTNSLDHSGHCITQTTIETSDGQSFFSTFEPSASQSPSYWLPSVTNSPRNQSFQFDSLSSVGRCEPEPKRRIQANARERDRTFSVNSAFNLLRCLIPTDPPSRKLSKIETLRLATSYITHLENVKKARLAGDMNDAPCNRTDTLKSPPHSASSCIEYKSHIDNTNPSVMIHNITSSNNFTRSTNKPPSVCTFCITKMNRKS